MKYIKVIWVLSQSISQRTNFKLFYYILSYLDTRELKMFNIYLEKLICVGILRFGQIIYSILINRSK